MSLDEDKSVRIAAGDWELLREIAHNLRKSFKEVISEALGIMAGQLAEQENQRTKKGD